MRFPSDAAPHPIQAVDGASLDCVPQSPASRGPGIFLVAIMNQLRTLTMLPLKMSRLVLLAGILTVSPVGPVAAQDRIRLRGRHDLLCRQHRVLQSVARRRNPAGHRESAFSGHRPQRARHPARRAVRRPPVRRRPQLRERAPGAGAAREERCHPLHHRIDRERNPAGGSGTGPVGAARAVASAAAGFAGVQPAGRGGAAADVRHGSVRAGRLDQLAAAEHRPEPGASSTPGSGGGWVSTWTWGSGSAISSIWCTRADSCSIRARWATAGPAGLG